MKTYVLILRRATISGFIDKVVYASIDHDKICARAKDVALAHGFSENNPHMEYSASYQEIYYERFLNNQTKHFIIQEFEE